MVVEMCQSEWKQSAIRNYRNKLNKEGYFLGFLLTSLTSQLHNTKVLLTISSGQPTVEMKEGYDGK